jgi:hypothetical protein
MSEFHHHSPFNTRWGQRNSFTSRTQYKRHSLHYVKYEVDAEEPVDYLEYNKSTTKHSQI